MVSFWLIPEAESKAKFQRVISDLAEEFDAPVFVPHVTVFTGVFTDAEAHSAVRTVLSDHGPITMEGLSIEHSPVYTETLFMQMKSSKALSTISEQLRERCSEPSTFELSPHMSLIYRTMSTGVRRRLKGRIAIPAGKISFDSVMAIETPLPVTERRHVESWRTILLMPL